MKESRIRGLLARAFEPVLPFYLRLRGSIPIGEEMIGSFYPRFIGGADVVVEVGANRGGSTLALSEQVAFVYSFEPVPSSFVYLRALTREKQNVKVFMSGASDSNCNAVFNKCDKSVADSRFRIRNSRYVGTVGVRLVRLDSIEFPIKPTCIIMDCEASEVEALRGARGLFDSGAIRWAMVETHYLDDGSSTLDGVVSIVKGYGFDFKVENDTAGLPWVLATRS